MNDIELWVDGSYKVVNGVTVNGWGAAIIINNIYSFHNSGFSIDINHNVCEYIALLEGFKLLIDNVNEISSISVHLDCDEVLIFCRKPIGFFSKIRRSKKIRKKYNKRKSYLEDLLLSIYSASLSLDMNGSNFVKVSAHSGNLMNELVHNLAHQEILNFDN